MRRTVNTIQRTNSALRGPSQNPKYASRVQKFFRLFSPAAAKRLFASALFLVLILNSSDLRAQSQNNAKTRSGKTDACDKTTVPVKFREGLTLAEVLINQKPLVFIVDSAGKTMINSDRVSLPLVRQIRTGAITVSGAERLELWDVVLVKSFVVGSEDLRDSNVLSHSLKPLETKLGQEVDGILGNDVLRLWDLFLVDYKRRILILQGARCELPELPESLFTLQRDALAAHQ